ncbi:MAG: putative thioesterase [Alteromonadaceae bacterium]|nr:MAG: putative thioesterase [Alteromonadaceae bacterium]
MNAPESKWFFIAEPRPSAKARFFCFHYAGSNANVFSSWLSLIPEDIELVAVQLPGRGTRFGEDLHASMAPLMAGLLSDIPALLDKPYFVFGHSLGAAVACELLFQLQHRNKPGPLHFFASGRRSPSCEPLIPPLHDYPQERFEQALRSFNGTPEQLFKEPELMELFSPILRADFKLSYDWQREPGVKLQCKASVLGGEEDTLAPEHQLQAWQQHFEQTVDVKLFPGGHFFITEHQNLLLPYLLKFLWVKP